MRVAIYARVSTDAQEARGTIGSQLESLRERVAAEAVVDVALLATLKKRGGLDQVAPLAEAGAGGFKLSLFETDSERFPQIPDDELLQAFRLIADTGLVVGVHAENTDVITSRVEALDPAGLMAALEHEPRHACGGGPMVAVLHAARRLGARHSRVLRYADSGDVSGDKSQVVGYMAAAIW